jgi:hypothetical protein
MSCSSVRARRVVVVLSVSLALATCGGGGKDGPPTAPPVPTPTPIAAPTPDPPLSASCARLPLGVADAPCRGGGESFLSEVIDAIQTVKSEHPEYFRGETVLNIPGYYVGLIRALDRQGLCAGYDGEELAVTNSSSFSDQYKVLTSWWEVRHYYLVTCTPAVVPLARRAPAPSPAGCSLPPSVEVACDRTSPQFYGDVEAAVDQVLKQKPELFDFDQKAAGTDWPVVKDMTAYHMAVVSALAAKGYCGLFDGEEIQLKRSNELSEHYDVNYADRYIRRGNGIFRTSCYPAAF